MVLWATRAASWAPADGGPPADDPLEQVLLTDALALPGAVDPPGTVSATTKSMGASDERPIWYMSLVGSGEYSTMTAWCRGRV